MCFIARNRSQTRLVIRGAECWSYAALEAAVLGAASGFLSQGLKSGDRLLMRLGNSVEFPIAYLAAIAADIIPVPILAFLTEPEVARIIADVSPRLIVAEEGLALPAEPARPVLPAKAMREMYGLTPAPYAMGEPDRPAYIIYTSGTSGHPRAVVHAHRTVWARRMMWLVWTPRARPGPACGRVQLDLYARRRAVGSLGAWRDGADTGPRCGKRGARSFAEAARRDYLRRSPGALRQTPENGVAPARKAAPRPVGRREASRGHPLCLGESHGHPYP